MSRKNRGKKQSRAVTNKSNQRPANQNSANSVTVQQTQTSVFSGPLPEPTILESYDRIVPGAAERILVMAEQDADHQRHMEKKAITAAMDDKRRGQRFGLFVALAALSVSVVAIFAGAYNTASIIGGTTVVGLASIFVLGRVLKKSG